MIRKIEKIEEKEKIYELSNYAFNIETSKKRKERFYHITSNVDTYAVINKDDNPVSFIRSLPFNVNFFGKQIKMNGIGSVSSYPENRGQGNIRNLFDVIFNDLKKNKVHLSFLAPVSHKLYELFGYTRMFKRQHFEIDKVNIKTLVSEKEGSLKRGCWKIKEDRETIMKLYTNTLEKHHGAMIRDEWWWQCRFLYEFNNEFAICFDNDKNPCGYLIYERLDSEFIVKEMAFINNFALRKLMYFVSSHATGFKKFKFISSLKQDITVLFDEPISIKHEIESYMMGRIVCFKEFIEKINWNNKGKAVYKIAVEDVICPWNKGTWKISLHDEKATCELMENEADYSFKGTIQGWTRFFSASISLEELVFLDIIVSDGKYDKKFDETIPKETLCLYDYF